MIVDEADRLQRLKELAEDEALALKLREEHKKGQKREEGGRKRACSSSRGRRIKRRAGRVIEEVVEEAVHQDAQPKAEPKEIGKIEQRRTIQNSKSTPLLVRTTIQNLEKRVSILEIGLSTVQTTLKEVKDNQLVQERNFSDQMEFLTGVMQQILDKLSSYQPSQIAPPQVLEDSSTKGQKGTVSIVDKGN